MTKKYSDIPKETIVPSLDRLIGKIYKSLPLKEEKCETLDEYLEGLVRELISESKVVSKLTTHGEFLSVISILHSLIEQEDFKIYRKDVFKCIDLVKKIKTEIENS